MDIYSVILSAALFSAPTGAGQWIVIKDAQVGVFNPNLKFPVQFCTVKAGGSVNKAQAGEQVYIYEHFGAQMRDECYGYVVISSERLSGIAVRTAVTKSK